MRWIVVAAVFAVALGALAACSKKKNSEGLPPAPQWNADQAAGDMPAAPAQGDPHAGMDMTNPHPGPVDPNGPNPHAGMDMTNPHGGGGAGGTDVSQLGLPAPDPDRKIDPSHHIRGVIAVGGAAKVPAGAVVFLAAKRPGPDGKPVDPPLAVERLTYSGGDLAFELGEAQAMVAGTELVGDVIIIAHYAQNGDALSRAAGDVIGSARVKVPAEGVKLTLDTVLP